MRYVPYVFETSELPEAVQRTMLMVPDMRDHLRANAFLSYGTWKQLLADHSADSPTTYLRANLTPRKAGDVLRLLATLPGDERRVGDVDLELSIWLRAHGVTLPNARLALASGKPNVANVALLHPELPLEVLTGLARNAYRAERLRWLASPVADPLGDDVVWEVATSPDTLEECCEGTMLNDRLTAEEPRHGAQLLHLRPGLVNRAILSRSPLWLLAASATKLDAAQQRLLVAAADDWKGPEATAYTKALSRGSYAGDTALDPLGNLAATPWCTDETWEHLRRPDRRPTWVDGDDLRRHSDYGFVGNRAVRDLKKLPAAELGSAPAEVAEAWVEDAVWSMALSAPFVALESLANRSLSRHHQRRRRETLRHHGPYLSEVLPRLGKRFPKECLRNDDLNWSDPETKKPREVRQVSGATPVREATLLADAGLGVLSEAGLTDPQWEVALRLLLEGFSGTVDDLVDVATRL